MNKISEHKNSINIYHLKQHELVNFLYDRYVVGMVITLTVSSVAAFLVYFELSFQDRENRVLLWYAGLVIILLLRYQLKRTHEKNRHDFLRHLLWRRRFTIGVMVTAVWLAVAAVLVMPLISKNLQYILHTFLLGMGAGAIAYLATSMMIFGSYLVLMIAPVALYLFWTGTTDNIILGLMHLFMIGAYFFGVKRMNRMIKDALHLRFDNEVLVNDLQRLLTVVASSNRELDHYATTDDLTGAANFRAFRVRLEELVHTLADQKLPLSLISVNIDYFHEYNVEYGIDIGNKTLVSVASLLMGAINEKEQMVARMNGAEFAVLLPSVSCEVARQRMQRVQELLEEMAIPHRASSCSGHVTLSMGICCEPLGVSSSAREFQEKAYEALREAKFNGRNRIEIASY